ncbi:hypothetical protein SAMN03159338_1488 [Sphingomonas sp. NFR04]|uniref:hypothetical protein n=1 Tax=Sphingomonas sp. NFR04 TaxID=1566283 RepID=UPI0008E27414|nr:hypothetical protein [Sphingomonas sp. NFR04]SFJ47326.1 hypothetical protein SAMN03159338_1488 [Sphingomonas sp. NFR04]
MTHIKLGDGVTVTTPEAIDTTQDVIRIAEAVISIGCNDYVAKDVEITMSKGRIKAPTGKHQTLIVHIDKGEVSIHEEIATNLDGYDLGQPDTQAS